MAAPQPATATDLNRLLSRRTLFRRKLLSWYELHRRELPWRKDNDPYRIWISEVMLQQTRVAAVVDYYARFLKRFPNVVTLARARDHSVLAAWSGLGYYRRARMLHAASRQVCRQHGGSFPTTSEQLKTLPGIGRYTAAAIASIAFGEPIAVVDGNVERVLSRLAGTSLTGEAVWSLANKLLDPSSPADFNQAMMELGALVCLPGTPNCSECPLIRFCATRGSLPPAQKPSRHKRSVAFALHLNNEEILLVQRKTDNRLMPGMWELPETAFLDPESRPWKVFRHSITNTDYAVSVHRSVERCNERGAWFATARLAKLPLTGLSRKILRAADLL